MKIWKRRKNEDGQAVIEFALVLPIFLILIFAIIEFGWLFYNYICVENSARNAARIACVEYLDDVAIPEKNVYGRRVKVLTYDSYVNGDFIIYDGNGDAVLNSDGDIYTAAFDTIKDTIPASRYGTVSVTVDYAYDNQFNGEQSASKIWNVEKRCDDDVTVTVTCDVKMLTGMFNTALRANHNKPGHDNGTKTLNCKSTFKVEKQHISY